MNPHLCAAAFALIASASLAEPAALPAPDAGADAPDGVNAADAGTSVEATAEPTPQSMETTVVGEHGLDLRRIAGSAQVVGREELERGEANDIHRILQAVPGVYVREEDGFGLRPNIGMRGVSPERSSKITLMEDDVLSAPAPYSAPAAYNFPLMTRMTSVEIFKGPASIRYGPQTVGGAINFRTAPVPTQKQADLDISYGTFGSRKAHGSVAVANESFGVLAEAVNLGSTGFKQLPGDRDTGFDKTELMLKASAKLSSARASHRFELKTEYGVERSNETYLGLSFEDFKASPQARYPASSDDQMRWWRSQLHLRWTVAVADRLEVTTILYRHDFRRNWHRFMGFRGGPDTYSLLAYPSSGTTREPWVRVLAGRQDSSSAAEALLIVDSDRRMHAEGLQSALTLHGQTGPAAHELEAGVRLHSDAIRRSHFAAAYDMVSGVLVPEGGDKLPVGANLGEARALSAYVADSVSFGGLVLAPGIRVEVIRVAMDDYLADRQSVNTSVTPLASLGTAYELSQGITAIAGVHQGFSPVAPGAGDDARPERSTNVEAGVRFARRATRFELIGFWSEYSNIRADCSFAAGCMSTALNSQFNGGAARVLGLELLASRRVRLGEVKLVVDGAYTLTKASFLTSFVSENPSWGTVAAGDELPYVPAHQGQLRALLQWKIAELSVSAAYYGELREVAGAGPVPEPVRVPGRTLLNATAAVDIGDGRIYATATNLLNQQALVSRRPFGARPQAPLLLQIGFKYAFR